MMSIRTSLALAVALLASALPASAQITITQAHVAAQLGASGTTTVYDAASASDLPALRVLAERTGGGQTWDVSALSWQVLESSAFAPATGSTPGDALPDLAGATHVVRTTAGDSTGYAYHRLTPSAFEMLGVAAEESGAFVAITFSPGQLAFPLPLTAGATWSRTSAMNVQPAFEGLSFELDVSAEVVGWGTLVMPHGTDEVLQIRARTISTSTLVFPGLPEPIVSADTSYTVEFLSTRGSAVSIYLDADGAAGGASYVSTQAGGTSTPEAPAADALGFALRSAHPARHGSDVTLGFALPQAADVRVEAFDALGRRVAVLADGPRAAGAQSVALATAALPAGLYVVRLTAGAAQATLRVTVAD